MAQVGRIHVVLRSYKMTMYIDLMFPSSAAQGKVALSGGCLKTPTVDLRMVCFPQSGVRPPKRKHTNNGMLSPVEFKEVQFILTRAGVWEARGTSLITSIELSFRLTPIVRHFRVNSFGMFSVREALPSSARHWTKSKLQT